uniref:CSON004870 protein n=1 Tax=Culicoides sonorensis TaxID=179676 RepID=A0A336MRK2_CULSO
MQRFKQLFPIHKCNIIGMIHVGALPGTPKYKGGFDEIIETAVNEAKIYSKYSCDGVLIENMHDIPYVQDKSLGPEITACMTKITSEVIKNIPKSIKCGIQILACGNKQALAVAKATNAHFIRAEGYVFSHVADEGFTDANAGHILRYRKSIDADNILIFTDIKKKHSSHSITSDVNLVETAHAAEFFLSDGVILTGTATGDAAKPSDLNEICGKIDIPILIGSGVTLENLEDYYEKSNGIIIGSYFKENGKWDNKLSESRIMEFMRKVENLRK